MFYNKYKNLSTYIIIFLISSAAFSIFLLSANISAHTEQTYEMTDHQIKTKAIDKTYEHSIPTNKGEQKDRKVFAFIN
ncbi:DNA damage-induced cell division inhibitor SosA [Staphylococcus schweitzeri]|uniref:DNA damage-induced cell division inhibitor SosA n=1 Tax=Staphylococcus schweitzeri TaxID=1654388 RepID=UPI0005065C50|nr:DNA damage-induced cell division inhibitor SosA [Staphylococcus schweitzeri]CDR50151.1 hypothetical protein ERS140159_00033 [Staphylococcus schweitzeri]CDR60406.1 hypothetical protein ERS140239_00197 [Staphylococcus schweitzeri]